MTHTTTPSIASIYRRIVQDFPAITFVESDEFRWAPPDNAVHHPPPRDISDLQQLLHELGHTELGHTNYTKDITLLSMEREAWSHAVQKLAPRYDIPLTMEDDIVEDSLDTYRTWLHKRSTCPACEAIGHEAEAGAYRCLSCGQSWRVNEAKTCRLQRHKT